HFEIETKSFEHRFDDYTSSPVERRVDNLQRFRLTNERWTQNERFEPVHVRFVDLLANQFYLTPSVVWQWSIGFGGDRVHFCNDTSPTRSSNSFEKNRWSCSMTSFGLAEIFPRAFQSCRYATSPCVARLTLKKFIAFVPTHGNSGRSLGEAFPRSATVTIFPT